MLSGWSSEHFGHWVPEYLCRLIYMVDHPRFAELPIIVDAGMPPQHLEYLRLVAPNPLVEIPLGGSLRCGELIVASPSTFFPTPSRNSRVYRRRIVSAMQAKSFWPTTVFILNLR